MCEVQSSLLSAELLVALASLLVSLVALIVSFYTIRRSDSNSSASLVLSLNEQFRSAWKRYLDAKGKEKDHELAELLNLMEIASAVYVSKSMVGVFQEIGEGYLCECLKLFNKNPDVKKEIENLIDNKNTYKYIVKFLKKNKTRIK